MPYKPIRSFCSIGVRAEMITMSAISIDVNISKVVVVGLPSVPLDLTGSRRHYLSSERQKGISAPEK
jgi:hypothetical protein